MGIDDDRGSTRPERGDLLAGLPATDTGEAFETLLERDGVRIERIVSRGHASPPGSWYDQEHAEWVLVLRGAARLEVESSDGEREAVELRPGGWIDLPAHRRHRVEWTDPEAATVWLALHWDTEGSRRRR